MNEWWKEKYALEHDEAGYWKIGPFQMRIERREKEFALEWLHSGDLSDETLLIEVPSQRANLGDGATMSRICVSRTDGIISLRPFLSDRAIIVNPESVLSIPNHEEIVMYVSSPLWIEVSIGKTPKTIMELPTYRLSDTWFGVSTLDGELCYASKTSARRDFAAIPLRHHQAYTAVKIKNNSSDLLNLENVKIPVRLLSIFIDREGRFWTNTVNLVREQSGAMAVLRLGESPPSVAVGTVRVAKPRDKQEQNLLIRAFGGLVR